MSLKINTTAKHHTLTQCKDVNAPSDLFPNRRCDCGPPTKNDTVNDRNEDPKFHLHLLHICSNSRTQEVLNPEIQKAGKLGVSIGSLHICLSLANRFDVFPYTATKIQDLLAAAVFGNPIAGDTWAENWPVQQEPANFR